MEFSSYGGLDTKSGEFSYVERTFTKSGEFSFTGSEKIESADDVAYIFRSLEDKAVENVFVVIVKDGVPTVVHIGMGGMTSSMGDLSAIRLAVQKAGGADKVYMVHNHPSGKLMASSQDFALLDAIAGMFDGDEVQPGIIMDTTSGKYGEFGEYGINEVKATKTKDRPKEGGNTPLDVLRFDKQVFAPDFDLESLSTIRSSADIASLVSSQRLGDCAKISFLTLTNANNVVANIHTTYSFLTKDNIDILAKQMADNALRFSGNQVVVYGDFPSGEKDIRQLKKRIEELSGKTVRLLDFITVKGKFTSAVDEGTLWEPGEKYGSQEVGEPTKVQNKDVKFSIRRKIGDFLRGKKKENDETNKSVIGNDGNSLSLQRNKNSEYEGNEKETSERDNDGRQRTDSGGVVENSTRGLEADRDRSDIRVFEETLAAQHNDDSEYSERNRREAESERLVSVAKDNGKYISREETKQLGKVYPKSTGESIVYIDKNNNKVYKVKDPYAKSPMKHGVQPEDVIYEHVVHNLLFPETRYKFEGVSDVNGDVRMVLSQKLVKSVGQPTKNQIDAALAERGLKPDGRYSYSNEYVTVTDVTGDNALLGSDGKVYFIDPIIGFKKPVSDVLDGLSKTVRFRSVKESDLIAEESEIVAKAKANGNYMKAPNGKPTNLSNKQWAQVRTPQFKAWFGDWEKGKVSSKVLDENGEPLVVYHGTRGDFTEFDVEKIGSNLDYGTAGRGYYFTTDRENAENIARNAKGDGEPRVIEAYLNIVNPKRNVGTMELDGSDKKATKFTDKAKADGYDGIEATSGYGISKLHWFVAFDKNQIKSATDNSGEFSKQDDDIIFRFIGEKGAARLDKANEATTRIDNLNVAREMERSGKDAKAIVNFYSKRTPSDTSTSSPEGNTPEGARRSMEGANRSTSGSSNTLKSARADKVESAAKVGQSSDSGKLNNPNRDADNGN